MKAEERKAPFTIAVVGTCTAGKTMLVSALREAGYNARHVAQEHSYVPDMWQRLTQPDVLIYLDVSYETARKRRQIHWGPERLAVQSRRLAHARAHCDLYMVTDELGAEEILARVMAFLEARQGNQAS